MADLKEIALGIASLLRSSSTPEPLPITFRGQTLEDGADLVLRIIAECQDADIHLSLVALDPALWGFLRAGGHQANAILVSDPELSGEARFYRYKSRLSESDGGPD